MKAVYREVWGHGVLGLAVILITASGAYAVSTVEMVKDINPSGGSTPMIIETVVYNGRVYFLADDGAHGFELWRTDGTPDGTYMLKDINPSGNAFLEKIAESSIYFFSPGFAVLNNVLYFAADDGAHGVELWRSDGTASGTILVKDINVHGGNGSFPNGLTAIGSTVYFGADDGTCGMELWKTDGTAAGTTLVRDINPSGHSSPYNFHAVNGVVCFVADDGMHGEELWATNGTVPGTTLIKDINTSGYSNISYMQEFHSQLYFMATDGVYPNEIWRADGTSAGTVRLQGLPSEAEAFTVFGDGLYLSSTFGSWGYELLKCDGSSAAMTMIKNINPTGSSYPAIKLVAGGLMYFLADDGSTGFQWWKSDGTSEGTRLIKVINPDGIPHNMAVMIITGAPEAAMDDLAFFRTNDGTHGWELWQSDGTEEQTYLVADIKPGDSESNSYPESLTPLGKTLCFWADDGTHGTELWVCHPDYRPKVESITRIGQSPTEAKTIQFAVTFSENVFGLERRDFSLAKSPGITDATIASITGSGPDYVVTVSGIGGQGTIRLDLIDGDTVTDDGGQPLGGVGTGNGDFHGESFEVVTEFPLSAKPIIAALLIAGALAIRKSLLGNDLRH